jgi:SAM-dependent methyltransferase
MGDVAIERDVPSPIDWQSPSDVAEWERTAQARPGRAGMFASFGHELRALRTDATVLELGSGPGFLAAFLLDTFPTLRLTLMDFSAPMHDLARDRLGPRAAHVTFLKRNFKDPDWPQGLGPFEAVITNQAVHELRHKRHAPRLHAAVRQVLRPGGVYLVADGFFGPEGSQNSQLHMTVPEQQAALLAAGFSQVELVATSGGLAMHRAV